MASTNQQSVEKAIEDLQNINNNHLFSNEGVFPHVQADEIATAAVNEILNRFPDNDEVIDLGIAILAAISLRADPALHQPRQNTTHHSTDFGDPEDLDENTNTSSTFATGTEGTPNEVSIVSNLNDDDLNEVSDDED